MTTLTASVPFSEVLEDSLLTLDQISTRITVLALNASRNSEQTVRVRALLSDLLADIQDCESELGTYGTPFLLQGSAKSRLQMTLPIRQT